MTDTITPTMAAGSGTVRPGTMTVGRSTDTDMSVWVYVIAVLSNTSVFGVNLGTNALRLTSEGPGIRFGTFTVDQWAGGETLTQRAGQEIRDALVSFLVGAGLPSPLDQAPRVQGDQDTDQAYARGVADGRREEETRHQAWLDSLVSDAHSFADEHSLCSEFDRFMSEHGLPTRRQEYTVTLSLSHTVSVSVEARDEDQAAEEAVQRFRDYPRDYVSLGDVEVEVEDVEEE